MKITVRSDSMKMDAAARALIIKALNDAAKLWLTCAGTQTNNQIDALLADVGNAKAFATLMEPKAES